MPEDEDSVADQKQKGEEIEDAKKKSADFQKKMKEDEEGSNLTKWRDDFKNSVNPYDGTVH